MRMDQAKQNPDSVHSKTRCQWILYLHVIRNIPVFSCHFGLQKVNDYNVKFTQLSSLSGTSEIFILFDSYVVDSKGTLCVVCNLETIYPD